MAVCLLWPLNRAGHSLLVLWFLFLSFPFFLAYSQRSQIGCLTYFYTWCGQCEETTGQKYNGLPYYISLRAAIITGSIARSASRRYLIYSEADFEVFRPTGARRFTDGGEIWHGGGDRSPRPCQFSPQSVQRVAPEGEKCQNRPLSKLNTGGLRCAQCCR